MNPDLAPTVFLVLAGLVVTLIFVISLNPKGNAVGLRESYWKWIGVDGLMEGQGTPVQPSRPITPEQPRPQPQRPPGQSRTPSGQRSGDSRPFVELTRKPDGGYHANCSIASGVNFMAHVDTGADKCTIDSAVAKALGISNPARLTHNTNVTIADGSVVKGSQQPIDWCIEGKIIVKDVPTIILFKGTGSNLIGMSLLKHLDIKISGDTMRLYQKS